MAPGDRLIQNRNRQSNGCTLAHRPSTVRDLHTRAPIRDKRLDTVAPLDVLDIQTFETLFGVMEPNEALSTYLKTVGSRLYSMPAS